MIIKAINELDARTIHEMLQAIFNDNYEETKEILSKTFNLDGRYQYCTEYEGARIGMGSAYFDGSKASIYCN